MSKADVGDKISPKGIAANAVIELKASAERAHMFEHAWRKLNDKFYNTNMHGIDWKLMKSQYAAKLPSITNNRDLGRMMEEMMGELNASHTGTYYRFRSPNADNTAGLGLILDFSNTKGALTIDEVLDKSPLKKAKSNIRAGMKLTAIDGVKLGTKTNLAQLLNNKAGKRVRLTIMKEDGNTFDEVTKPLSLGEEGQLLYERWVKIRGELVKKLSAGKIGYVHIRGMNDASYRTIYSEILGQNFDKEAIIVDTRWNGGGWLHNDLAKLLSGKNYMNLEVRGRKYSGEPMDQWYKPSLIVMNAGNYSDAHTFPYTYKALNIGDAVGMPVPGTSTSVWWETMNSGDLTFGVPQVGNLNMKGEYLENRQVDPDYLVKNDPESSAAGEDKQIIKAVEVMLKTLTK
jgi:C-terminal processing protease CtpA/Prc